MLYYHLQSFEKSLFSKIDEIQKSKSVNKDHLCNYIKNNIRSVVTFQNQTICAINTWLIFEPSLLNNTKYHKTCMACDKKFFSDDSELTNSFCEECQPVAEKEQTIVKDFDQKGGL